MNRMKEAKWIEKLEIKCDLIASKKKTRYQCCSNRHFHGDRLDRLDRLDRFDRLDGKETATKQTMPISVAKHITSSGNLFWGANLLIYSLLLIIFGSNVISIDRIYALQQTGDHLHNWDNDDEFHFQSHFGAVHTDCIIGCVQTLLL